MKRSAQDQYLHDSLVKTMVSLLKGDGFSVIRADIPGFQKPGRVFWRSRRDIGYAPDLTCRKDSGETTILVEADTWTSINSLHTENQWRLFRLYANENNAEFRVVLPKKHPDEGDLTDGSELVTKVANELGVVVDRIWTV